MSKLAEVYKQIPAAICPPGCGQCCGPTFPSLAELRHIQAWCDAHHVVFKDFLAIAEDGNCPYLAPDKGCTIYPVRPFICRLLGASIDLPCPVGKCQTTRLLNKPQSGALYKAIYLHGKETQRTQKHQRVVMNVLEQLTREGRI